MGLLQSNYKSKNLLIVVVRGAIVRKKIPLWIKKI
jgi:hypothetical protein